MIVLALAILFTALLWKWNRSEGLTIGMIVMCICLLLLLMGLGGLVGKWETRLEKTIHLVALGDTTRLSGNFPAVSERDVYKYYYKVEDELIAQGKIRARDALIQEYATNRPRIDYFTWVLVNPWPTVLFSLPFGHMGQKPKAIISVPPGSIVRRFKLDLEK